MLQNEQRWEDIRLHLSDILADDSEELLPVGLVHVGQTVQLEGEQGDLLSRASLCAVVHLFIGRSRGGSYTVAEGRTTGGDRLIVHIVILGNFTAHSNFYKSLEHLWRFSLRLSLG